MSAHVLLNSLNELGKSDKMRGLSSFFNTFATSLINSTIQEHECKIHFISTLKHKHLTDLEKQHDLETKEYDKKCQSMQTQGPIGKVSGADPGYLERGFRYKKEGGGSLC